MQQQRENRGGVEEMKQNQDRRLNPTQPENLQQPAPPQQPQKCPRCESLNTKFCYYNNYSLSQPRYFCKTCRRYWTQGGTLRNVPVGGGCRKGKRTKTSSSSSADNSNSRSHPQQLSQQKTHQNLTSSAPMVSNSALPAIPSVASLYPGGGFLSSLAAIQSLNQPQSFNQNLSDNFGLLQGFNVPSFSSQQHQKILQGQFYQIDDNRDHKNMEALHPNDQEEGLHIQHDWNQSFVNNSIPSTVSDATFWSINGGATGNAAGSSMNPNQWPDLPEYGAPP